MNPLIEIGKGSLEPILQYYNTITNTLPLLQYYNVKANSLPLLQYYNAIANTITTIPIL